LNPRILKIFLAVPGRKGGKSLDFGNLIKLEMYIATSIHLGNRVKNHLKTFSKFSKGTRPMGT